MEKQIMLEKIELLNQVETLLENLHSHFDNKDNLNDEESALLDYIDNMRGLINQ